MNTMMLLKIINELAIITAVANSLMFYDMKDSMNGVIFIWVCIGTFLLSRFKEKSGVLKLLPILLMISGALVYHNGRQLGLTGILIVSGIYIALKTELRYSVFQTEFMKFVKVIVLLLFIAILTFNYGYFERFSLPFIIIYLVSGIIILRSLRYLENVKTKNNSINRINFGVSLSMIVFSVALCIDPVRNLIYKLLMSIYAVVSEIILKLFGSIIYGIAYISFRFLEWFFKLIESLRRTSTAKQAGNNNTLIKFKNVDSKEIARQLHHSKLINVFIIIVILSAVLYTIYRIIRTTGSKKHTKDDYEESREYIEKNAQHNKRLLEKFRELVKPKTNEDLVKYYYKKYMVKCIENHIEINENDTTYNINQKANPRFDSSITEKLRKIYIGIRYGNCTPTEKDAADIKSQYKRL